MSGVLNFGNKPGLPGATGAVGISVSNQEWIDEREEPIYLPPPIIQVPSMNAPLVFNGFANPNIWSSIVHSNYFSHAYDAQGRLTIDSVGALGGSNNIIFSGILLRYGILPNDAGLIDIAFTFDNISISNPAANTQWALCLLLTHATIGGSAVASGIGMSATTVFPHGFYTPYQTPSLYANTALAQFGTSTGDMATNLVSARIRFQLSTLFQGADFKYLLDHPAASYEHNGLPAVVLGGALTGTGIFGNSFVARPTGLTLSIGVWNQLRMPGVGMSARLTGLEILAGKLVK
jgi:hypothetical protein